MRIAFFFLWTIHFLPISLIHRLAQLLGSIAFLLAKERRHIGLTNLTLCFPEMNAAKRRTLVRKNMQYMIQMVLEYGITWWGSAERIQSLVTIKNLHYVNALRDAGQNVILFYPHFVGFEMCVYALNPHLPLVSIYSHQKNPLLDKQIYTGRQRYNNAYIISRQESLRTIIKAMNYQHTPLLYLPDQDFGPRDSIFVDFFGVKAATITGLSRLSRLAKATVIPAIPKRVGHRFELEFYPPWHDFPSDDIVADTRRMNAFLEERINEMPEQYFWLHKRFKSRPKDDGSVY